MPTIGQTTQPHQTDRERWLEERRTGIGGSDAASVLGLNPWKSAIRLYLDKTGASIPGGDNERMRIGRDLEGYVAQRFTEATGFSLQNREAILRHPRYDFMIATVDRLIKGENAGLECKTTNSYAAKEWAEDIPVHYEIQCHHYMAVTGCEAWWIAVLIGNERFLYKKIDRDEALIEKLIAAEKAFWYNHVLEQTMPAPDGSEDASEVINACYSETEAGGDAPLDYLQPALNRLRDVKALIKTLNKEKKQLEQQMKLALKNDETGRIGQTKISWKPVHSTVFDTKNFKSDYPDLYNRYTREKTYRRFNIGKGT